MNNVAPYNLSCTRSSIQFLVVTIYKETCRNTCTYVGLVRSICAIYYVLPNIRIC